jgi:hypothetical protein
MRKDDSKDLDDVMTEEERRGRRRRPIDLKSRRERNDKLAALRKYLRIATKEEFVKAMLAYGVREGSQQYLDALEAWHEYRD